MVSKMSMTQKWLNEMDTIRVWTNYLPRAVRKHFAVRALRKVGCTNETCTHFSHDPSAPIYELSPIQPVVVVYNQITQETRQILFYSTKKSEPVLIMEEDLKGRWWDKLFCPTECGE